MFCNVVKDPKLAIFWMGSLYAAACFAVNSPADLSPTFSIEQAVNVAIGYSPRIKIYEARVDELRSHLGAAKAHFLPKVGVATGLEKKPSYGTDATRVAYGYATWNLFNGFDDRRNVQLTGYDIASAEIDLLQAKHEIACDVETRFYEVVGALEQLELLQSALQLNGNALKDARQRRGAGMSTDSDVIAFEVRGSRLEADIHETQAQVAALKGEFNRLLGYDVGPAIQFSGTVPYFKVTSDFNALLKSTKDSSFAMRRAAIDIDKADTEAAKWISGVTPKIDLEAHNGWLPIDERSAAVETRDVSATSIVLIAKMDLFTGLSSVEDRRAAISRKTQTNEQLREVSMTIVNDLERHWRQLILMQDRIALEQLNAQKTKRLKDTVAREYRSGLKTGSDYANAVDMLTDAEQRRLNAILSWHRERSTLEKISGQKLVVEAVKQTN